MDDTVLKASEVALDDRDWGPVGDDDTTTLNIPNRAHDWVKVKLYITEGDDAAASQAAAAAGVKIRNIPSGNRAQKRSGKTETEQTFHFDTAAHKATLLQRMIRDWSFKDKAGHPIPVTAQSIAALPVFTSDFIMEAINKLNPSGDIPVEDDEEELDQHGENTGPLGEPTNDS